MTPCGQPRPVWLGQPPIMGFMVRTSQNLRPFREPAPLWSAATVLLLRDGAQGLEVLMTRRAMTASFAPGAYVFPGGGIDDADALAHAHAQRRPTQSDTALTQAIAAIRESFEELGVLLAYRADQRMATAQDIALLDARKGLKMFEKVGIPILGIVENMSTHICSNCGHEEHIFGAGGGEAMCKDYNVDLLGSLPLDIKIREQSDGGKPTVIAEPNSQIAKVYKEIARKTASKLSNLGLDHSSKFPNIVIQNT